MASFATQDTSFSTSSYPLANSVILDCGSPIHIYNDLNRFNPSTYKKNDRVNPIFTGDSCSYVKGYSSIKVNVTTPTGEGLFELKNMVYIFSFYTNIMSHKRLRQIGYY